MKIAIVEDFIHKTLALSLLSSTQKTVKSHHDNVRTAFKGILYFRYFAALEQVFVYWVEATSKQTNMAEI